MRQFVIDLLTKNLPKTYYYHGVEHTLNVTDKVIEIGNYEKCSKEEIRLLTAAALWHDTGFIRIYAHNEEVGCEFARKHLPEFGYNDPEIKTICELIMATKTPQKPNNKLEEIICDADLEYLGTEHVERISNALFEELRANDPTLTKEKWNTMQISFLKKHNYFTNYCKQNRNPSKLNYLDRLIKNSSN